MQKREATVCVGSARVTRTTVRQIRVPAGSSEQSRSVDRGVFGSVGKRLGRRGRREKEREERGDRARQNRDLS